MIRIGILGAAKIAPPALINPARLRDDCEIVAVAARDSARAQAYAAENTIPDIAESYEALIARDDIDLIYNALPPHRHADLTIAALEAGKAVLCEKPFAMNAVEAARMADTAQRTGRVLIEAFHYRFHPAFQRVFDIVRSGRLGTIRRVDAAFDVTIPYRPGELRHTLEVGGGALMDLGCYPVHWVRTLVGTEPEIVSATAHCDRPSVDTSMAAELSFPGGEAGSIHTTMAPDTKFDAWIRGRRLAGPDRDQEPDPPPSRPQHCDHDRRDEPHPYRPRPDHVRPPARPRPGRACGTHTRANGRARCRRKHGCHRRDLSRCRPVASRALIRPRSPEPC